MPRPKAPCGEYAAYRRHLRNGEKVDAKCRAAQRRHDRVRSGSAPARAERVADKPRPVATAPTASTDVPVLPPPSPPASVSRLEVLKELLEAQRLLLPNLQREEPARAYLLMREQRETLREIDEIQNAGATKGASLADQLAQARAARASRAAGA